MKIGIISDTHGLLRASAADALKGVDLILHAGDIDTPQVFAQLNAIAPVHGVRGNMDRHPEMRLLPSSDILSIAGRCVYMIHDLTLMDIDPDAAGVSVVVSGHTHVPKISQRGPVLYINPGSAGPKRFQLPVSVGLLEMGKHGVTPAVIALPA